MEGMELGTDEANLIYEDRIRETDTSSRHGDSEDEDFQKEVEVMLYSHVYFDDSSIKETTVTGINTCEQSVTVKPLEPASQQSKSNHKISGRNEITLPSAHPQLPLGCSRSQFNHPNRMKASRYYDVHHNTSQWNATFIAPRIPDHRRTCVESELRHEFSAPTDFTEKLMARSANEKLYLPSSHKSKLSASRQASEVASVNPENVSNLVIENQVNTKVGEQLVSRNNVLSEKASSLNTAEVERNKTGIASSSDTVLAKKRFEAKASKVLSSMLDDESQSSLDENQSISCASHGQRNLHSDSSWTVGMSWADMSSKSFEVDIEEESVCSLQLPDNSFTADSGTNTPDLDGQIETSKDEDPSEHSRYNLQLKNKPKDNEDTHETDSESEASSIVEVAPPVKPAPVLVDISDDVPMQKVQEKILKPRQSSDKDIILVGARKNIVELTIDSSSDDDPVILDSSMQSSKSNRITPTKLTTSTKRNSEEPSGPRKRLSAHKDHDGVLQQPITSDLHKDNNFDELDQWLHNPIKSSRFLDHTKLLRKMSDDPKLWKICQADISGVHYSSRGPKCHNCNQFGHKTKFCPAPHKVIMCHMCGAPGHSETRCTQKMCLRCGRKNNVFVERCKECAIVYADPCKICRSRNHQWEQCPDLWRRYHMTVSEGEIVRPSQVHAIPKEKHYCSNCAGKGHLSHECKKSQWKCESISPFIVSYESPSSEDRDRQNFAMLLTNVTAGILSSAPGHNFLQCLSEELNVKIQTSLDIDVKKIVLHGTSTNALETRARILAWIKEQKKKGPEKKFVEMYLNKTAVDLWSSPEGKAYIQKVSREFGVIIHPSFLSHNTKKFLLEGKDSDVENTRVKMRQWIATQKKIEGRNMVLYRKVCHLPPSVPRNLMKLANFLEEELKLLESHELTGLSIRELYDCMCSFSFKNADSKIIEARKCCARLLRMILVGKCGLAGGYEDVNALKTLVTKLRQKAGSGNGLTKEVRHHYQAIFSGSMRDDFESLVETFYANESLVEKCERQVLPKDPCEVAVNHAQSSQAQSSGEKEGLIAAAQHNTRGIVRINSVNMVSETTEDDVWPQKAVERSHWPQKFEASCPVQNFPKERKLKKNLKNHKEYIDLEKEKILKKDVCAVLKTLNSRFLVSKDQGTLVQMFKTYCMIKRKKSGVVTQRLLLNMKNMKDKLCKSHNILV